ncbi:hypothetical protein Q3H58_002970 [Pseudomonas psychrotolerans]|nr:hypothetical protein [Pseudomonas psychrotolerans]
MNGRAGRLWVWLAGLAAGLALGGAQAALRLELDTQGLTPAQVQATQHLLDEAQALLPPTFKAALDERIQVHWSDELLQEAYGEADRHTLQLNRRLLASLVDGSDTRIQTGRPHGTQHRELLATVLHELTHFYDREQVWTPAQRQLILYCGGLDLTSDKLPLKCQGQAGRSYIRCRMIRGCWTWLVGR